MIRTWLYGIAWTTLYLCSACTDSAMENVPPCSGDSVRIELLQPAYYDEIQGFDTRSGSEDFPRDLNPIPDLIDLPEGSTVWLSYEELLPDGQYTPAVVKAYVVRRTTAGYTTLYPCTSKDSTDLSGTKWKVVDDKDASDKPLYLKNGTYRFKTLSPALPLLEENLCILIDNGMYFYATDERYNQTCSENTQVTVNQTGVEYLHIKPMLHQTARFHFTIQKGENVSTLEMLNAGIEISGIQLPYKNGRIYNWSSCDIADTLVMRRGDKRAWVRIEGKECTTLPDGTIQAHTGVLPTNAQSNSIAIVLNMAVNGVPTQYETLLNMMILKHAYSYNLKMTISLQDGIVVTTWQNQSWTEELPLN